MPSDSDTILVTGATGYIGGRLVPRLLGVGCRVRCLVRDAGRLRGRSWLAEVEVVEGDVLKPQTLARAVAGVSVAYYLIHMSDAAGFHARDLMAARSFGEAAGRAGVTRIIYLGGLGDPGADLSPHLRSRQETGAAMVIGVGSVSFEVIRYLTERLPVLVCPKWVYTRVQPVSTRNVLDYLCWLWTSPTVWGRWWK